MLTAATPLAAQEVTVAVEPDSSVHVTQGYALERVSNDEGAVDNSEDASSMTVRFPEENPAVYELDSDEDYVMVVDGSMPEGADILMKATVQDTGEEVEAFEHVMREGDWMIDARFMAELPLGEVTISATLRTPGRPEATVSHPFFVLEPNAIAGDEQGELFDWELDDLSLIAPFVPGEGFLEFAPPADARVYYVSATGSDSNDGLSESRPLRTPAAAYGKIRDGSGDWILLKAGEVFEGGFVGWSKSGRSLEQPLHVGVYGEGGRPVVHTNGRGFWRATGTVSNVRIDGIHAYANARIDVPEEELAWREDGINFFGRGGNIVLHDVKVEGFRFGIIYQGFSEGAIQNMVLIRTIVNNSFGHFDGAIAGHSSGIFTYGVNGIRFRECTFDRNGWHPTVSGAARTIFNHNIYVQYNCSDVAMRGCVVTRGSSHGMQLRCGGDVVDSLYVRNALAFFVALSPSLVLDNVVLESDDISNSQLRGHGIGVQPLPQATLANNIVANKVGRAGAQAAIQVAWTPAVRDFPSYNIELRDNVVWDWPRDELSITDSATVTRSNNAVDGVVSETGAGVVYNDPTADFDGYVDGGLSEFLLNAVNRRRGEWNETYTAAAFNAYMRNAFSTGGSGGGSGGDI